MNTCSYVLLLIDYHKNNYWNHLNLGNTSEVFDNPVYHFLVLVEYTTGEIGNGIIDAFLF